MDRPLRLLFIARSYPPSVGGMENFAFRLGEHLGRICDVTVLANRNGKKALPLFAPYALFRAALIARSQRVDAVHLGDALLAPLGVALKRLTGVPVTASVCGLDVTYPNRLYQAVVPRALARLDMTMPISEATAGEVRSRCRLATPLTVIPLGVNPLPAATAAGRRAFQEAASLPPAGRTVLTVGRLIKRKGVAWFVQHVLPGIPADVTYVVIGEGPDREAIERAAAAAGVAHRVRMPGEVSRELLAAAYRSADLFVMPNIPVDGDVEGFGLVALEAASSGLPVIASALEGITEAIQHRKNGLLIRPGQPDEWTGSVCDLLARPANERRTMGEAFARFTAQAYGWDVTAARYVGAIGSVTRNFSPSQDGRRAA